MKGSQNMKMSAELNQALKVGKINAQEHRDEVVRIEHVLYGILTTNNYVNNKVKERVNDIYGLTNELNQLNSQITSNYGATELPIFSQILSDHLNMMINMYDKKEENKILTPQLFFYALKTHYSTNKNNELGFIKIFESYGITKDFIEKNFNLNKTNMVSNKFDDDSLPKNPSKDGENKKTSKTPVLDSLGRDLTKIALEGGLDSVIGRDAEIDRVIQILARRKKNNPLLIGDPGVGKTALAEGLAIKIVNNDCPMQLQGKKIISLEVTSLVAGTKYRGQFEERVKSLIDELKNNSDIILFIDEIHTLIGAGGSSGSLDAANTFKPALARGEIQCIGATTINEYKESIEKDGALDRRFQKIIINPPNKDQTKEILMNIKSKYEDFHKVTYTDEAINEIVRLSDRYITNREFPDKAIDVLDESGAKTHVNIKTPKAIINLESELDVVKKEKLNVVKTQKYELAAELRDKETKLLSKISEEKEKWFKKSNIERPVVDVNTVYDVISTITNIPISKISENDIKKILSLNSDMGNSVIGQEEAISKVTSAIKRSKTGIRKHNRPIGTFLFVGPTGVGKTLLAKKLAEHVFGSEDALIRIDMSEYGDSFSSTKIIGSPPGYIGYNEGGQLTEKVKNKPYSVVLFDEVEKAHPDIFNILLQLLDEGHITDSSGRKINFKNTIIILTSNIGIKEAQNFKPIGYSFSGNNSNKANDIIEKSIKNTFKPEFINRLDDIIFFNHLSLANIEKIVDIEFKNLKNRLGEINITFDVSDDVKKKICELGYDEEYGARELNRVMQKYIEDPMSDIMLINNLPDKCHMGIKMGDDEKIIIEMLN